MEPSLLLEKEVRINLYRSCQSHWFKDLFTESAVQTRMLSSTSETPSLGNMMSKSHPETSYPGSRVQNSNLSYSSGESNKYKIDGNGKWIN